MKREINLWNALLAVNYLILGQVCIQKGTFLVDSQSLRHYVTALSFGKVILRRISLGYQISKNAVKTSHLYYMDDLKLYGKSLLNTVRIFSYDASTDFG